MSHRFSFYVLLGLAVSVAAVSAETPRQQGKTAGSAVKTTQPLAEPAQPEDPDKPKAVPPDTPRSKSGAAGGTGGSGSTGQGQPKEKGSGSSTGVDPGQPPGPQGPPKVKSVDLNSAQMKDLMSLSGMTDALANQIINGRPFAKPSDLVDRNLMSPADFNRIKGSVVAKPAK